MLSLFLPLWRAVHGTDVIWSYVTPYEVLTGRTAFIRLPPNWGFPGLILSHYSVQKGDYLSALMNAVLDNRVP